MLMSAVPDNKSIFWSCMHQITIFNILTVMSACFWVITYSMQMKYLFSDLKHIFIPLWFHLQTLRKSILNTERQQTGCEWILKEGAGHMQSVKFWMVQKYSDKVGSCHAASSLQTTLAFLWVGLSSELCHQLFIKCSKIFTNPRTFPSGECLCARTESSSRCGYGTEFNPNPWEV